MALAVSLTLFVANAYFFGGSGFNQNSAFDLTRSLVERHRLEIDQYAVNTADLSFYGGHYYTNKAPGLSLLAAIPYALIHAAAGPPKTVFQLTIDLYICTVAVCGIAGAGIGVLVFILLRKRGFTAASSAATALLTGIGTPLFAYSTMLFPHVPSAFLVVLALLLIEADRPASAGAALGAAGLTNYLCIPVAVIFLLIPIAPRGARLQSASRIVFGALPFALALAAYQAIAFGSPFRTSIATENPAFHERGAAMGVLHGIKADALFGITFSPYRGLFYIAPVLLLAIPGLVFMASRRDQRSTAAIIGATALLLILINASFFGWHGGYAIGPRYLLPVVPLLAVAMHYIATRIRLLWGVLAVISILFNFASTAVDPQPPDSLQDPIGRYEIPALLFGGAAPDDAAVPIWIRQLYTGHTSTNRVAADELMPFSRHPPGSPESEWASFNLGEMIFGAGSAWSLLPFFLLLGAGAAVTFRLAKTAPQLLLPAGEGGTERSEGPDEGRGS